MPNHEDYPIDRTGSLWDRIWRGRSSSHRRNLDNVALEASRVATLIGEGARLVDDLPGEDRALEIAGVVREIRELIGSMSAVADHLQAEAGTVPSQTRRPSMLRWLWRDFLRWLHG